MSSPRTAQSSGVVPSASAVLTEALPAGVPRIAWTAAPLPDFTASTSERDAPAANRGRRGRKGRRGRTGKTFQPFPPFLPIQPFLSSPPTLREDPVKRSVPVAELLHVAAESVRHRQPQIADRRAHGQLDVPVALAHAAAEADDGEGVGEVPVGIAHAAAAEHDGVIEKGDRKSTRL